jgi:hypothetical protein
MTARRLGCYDAALLRALGETSAEVQRLASARAALDASEVFGALSVLVGFADARMLDAPEVAHAREILGALRTASWRTPTTCAPAVAHAHDAIRRFRELFEAGLQPAQVRP